MTQLRIGGVAALSTILALWAGDVFDQLVWSLLVAAVIPSVTALVVSHQRWFVRVATGVVSIALTATIVVLIEGGGLDDIGTPFGPGLRRLLSTEWPSPVRPDLVGTVAVAIALGAALSAEFASRRQLHLSPLAPIAAGAIFVIGFSAPRGVSWVWPTALAVVATAFAAIGPVGPLSDRVRVLRGERRVLAVFATVAVVTGLFATFISMSPRADPRATEDPDRTAALLDPIEATLALQQLEPAAPLHVVELTDGDEMPTRWRTAALSDYNGRRWTPDLSLRPIGRRLATPEAVAGPVVAADIVFLDDDLQLVPLPGQPVTIDAAIETDLDRTLVRLAERPTEGTSVAISSTVEPTLDDVTNGQIATREVDESVSGLVDLAEGLAEVDGSLPATVLGRLRAIEEAMRNDFILDPDASGGGLQRALVDRFLRETQQGNAEQFSTGFVLIARSLGVDARVATGFVVEASQADGRSLTLGSTDAAIWPEVRIGGDWIAFDPVPAEPLANAEPPPVEPNVQSPAAPQPPTAPPPETAEEAIEQDGSENDGVTTGVSDVVEIATRVAAVSGIVLLPLLIVVMIILGLKWRRRRRRLSGAPSERIHGAWQEATDHLVDAGLSIGAAMTNDEIARAGRPHAPGAIRELERLATLSTAVTFGDPARPDLLADDASTCLDVVEESVDTGRSLRFRMRRRLSVRSLRSMTRSPV